mgnify:CR=1 FL=1
MSIETKIFATIRMYLQAYENRFDNPEALQKWAERADALYSELHETRYNMTYVREHLFFNMAFASTDYYLICDLRKYLKNHK